MARAQDRGSIFIETMISAAIVAMMLGGLFQAMASGAARHRMSEERRTALLIAQSQLAAVGHELSLTPGRTARLQGDYVAEIEVAPYAGGMSDSAAGALSAVTVRVTSRADNRPLASLSTLRLGQVAR